MKAIILAGGSGTRLYPITLPISKQLLPIYDKPMIFYPLSTVMLAGVRDILLITTPHDQALFQKLLGDGSQWGIKLQYCTQDKPRGIADAFIVGEEFIGSDSVCLMLGDNIFHGHDLAKLLPTLAQQTSGATVLTYPVRNPQQFGVIQFDENDNPIDIVEKPVNPPSQYAVTGLYFYDNKVVQYAKQLKPSKRGELEITDINRIYLKAGELNVKRFGRGIAWLDTGTPESLVKASQFFQTIEDRQFFKIGCPEEIAFNKGFISKQQLQQLAEPLMKSSYGKYLMDIADGHHTH